MLFNSVDYLIFFTAVVAVYYAIPSRWRWVLLLVASYFFYMCWKAEYAFLILFTTLVDYFAGIKMGTFSSRKARKPYLLLSVLANIGMLVGFKYLNFFSESINLVFREVNLNEPLPLFNILLPIGISFFVFQSLSYTIDVYRGIRTPEKHAGMYALYVSFFPQLVAGPIERSTQLLPQIRQPHTFSQPNLVSGVKLMLWGYFKKLVIADRLGMYVDNVYSHPTEFAGLSVILATVLFAFQLYCDFSGYTDIARGSARILGFELMINFDRPMTAKSIRDFWNRWHISLTTWFRDYVLYSLPYIKDKRVVYGKLYFNVVITFLLMGLWHGAKWTFVIFGLIHGLFIVVEAISEKQRHWLYERIRINRIPVLKNFLGMAVTFVVIIFSLLFFRSDNLGDSLLFLTNAFDFSTLDITLREIARDNEVLFGMLMIAFLLLAEYLHKRYDLVRFIAERHPVIRWSLYIGFIFFVLIFGVLQKQKFIYFQF